MVASTAVGMLGPGPEAEEVGQKTFIKFYEALDQFRGEARLGTYLTRIAINTALNAQKKQKRRQDRFLRRDYSEQAPPASEEEGAGRKLELEELGERVHEGLQVLSAKHRKVVVCRMLRGLSTKETAQVLEIPEGTVMSRLYRAKDRLREILRPYYQDHQDHGTE